MMKNPKGDRLEPYLYFISDLKDAQAIARHYYKRWKIECCFKNLKTNGFNIEDINIQSDEKIELMVAVLAALYLIAVREGILRHLCKPHTIEKDIKTVQRNWQYPFSVWDAILFKTYSMIFKCV